MSKRSVIFITETQELVLGFLTSLNYTMLTEYLKYAQKFSLYRSKKKKKEEEEEEEEEKSYYRSTTTQTANRGTTKWKDEVAAL